MGLAATLVEDLPILQSVPARQQLSEDDPEYWAEFHALSRQIILERLQNSSPDIRAEVMRQVDEMLLRWYLLEVQHTVQLYNAEAGAQRALAVYEAQPTSEASEEREMLLKTRDLALEHFRQLRASRGELQKLREHGYFPEAHPIALQSDGVTLDPSKMQVGVPYVFDIDGDTMAAVKHGDLDIEIYDLSIPEGNG